MHARVQIYSWRNYANNPSHHFRILQVYRIYMNLYLTLDGYVLSSDAGTPRLTLQCNILQRLRYMCQAVYVECQEVWRSWNKFPLVQDSTSLTESTSTDWSVTMGTLGFSKNCRRFGSIGHKSIAFRGPKKHNEPQPCCLHIQIPKHQWSSCGCPSVSPLECVPHEKQSPKDCFQGHSVLPKPEFTSSRSLHTCCDRRNWWKFPGVVGFTFMLIKYYNIYTCIRLILLAYRSIKSI